MRDYLREDDSCPSCGHANGTGLKCLPECPVECRECGGLHRESDCPHCWVEGILANITEEQRESLKEALE